MLDIIKQKKEYIKIYNRFVDNKENYFEELNDAELMTEDYKYRHGQEEFRAIAANKKMGCLRWKGIYQNIDFISKMVSGYGVDLGGAASPVHESSIIVDLLKEDSLGRKIIYSDILDVPGELDYIFSSHCLEHIENYKKILKNCKHKLKKGGTLFLHLPAYTCKRWLPKVHNSSIYGKHMWSFCISNDKNSIKRSEAIDLEVGKLFEILKCEYVGDNSIVLIARKNS